LDVFSVLIEVTKGSSNGLGEVFLNGVDSDAGPRGELSITDSVNPCGLAWAETAGMVVL
jgi:hypothetical protein